MYRLGRGLGSGRLANVGGGWGRQTSSGYRLLRGWRRLGFSGIGLGAWRGFGRFAAILLQQLLGRVILGCDLELLDGLVALFLELIEVMLCSRNAIVKPSSTGSSHNVDSAKQKPSACVR